MNYVKFIPLNLKKNIFAIVDADDYDRLIQKKWHMSGEYAVTGTFMHREILRNVPRGTDVDHIDGDKTDNRKVNLRKCSRAQNNQNASIRSDNKSGFKGITWHKKSNKWLAFININKNRIHLGTFGSKKEAIATRAHAEAIYFGEYSYYWRGSV